MIWKRRLYCSFNALYLLKTAESQERKKPQGVLSSDRAEGHSAAFFHTSVSSGNWPTHATLLWCAVWTCFQISHSYGSAFMFNSSQHKHTLHNHQGLMQHEWKVRMLHTPLKSEQRCAEELVWKSPVGFSGWYGGVGAEWGGRQNHKPVLGQAAAWGESRNTKIMSSTHSFWEEERSTSWMQKRQRLCLPG